MIQATLDSVVCRAQFFFPLNCKKQNRKKKQTKTTKNKNHKSREIHKLYQSLKILTYLLKYLVAKIMCLSL